MKIPLPVLVFAAAVFPAGCASSPSGGAGHDPFITIHATVQAFDPDGAIFDLVRSERTFHPGTVARGPLAKVMVTEPRALAGREYTILLPEGPAATDSPQGSALRVKGTPVVFGLPEAFRSLEPRQIIDFRDLRWPDQPAGPSPKN